MRLAGLPFTSNATNYGTRLGGATDSIALNVTSYYTGASVRTSSTSCDLFQAPTGGGAEALIAIDTAGTLAVSGSYYV
jgi:hypothetical protein